MPKKSKEEYNEYMRKYMLKLYHRRRKQILEKLGGKCNKCESIENLEIDHIDPSKKSFPVAKLYSIKQDKFWTEIAKCQLLCEKCHIKKTIKDKGHNSRDQHGTHACYQYSKCRCGLCRKANTEINRKYKKYK